MATDSTSSADWPGRYYHIDQVLDTPGPRTDPAFLAGDGVRVFCFSIFNTHPHLRLGKKLFAKSIQDFGYRCWRSGLRDFGQFGAYRLQGHSRN